MVFLKDVLRKLLHAAGYHIMNRSQFGNDILDDLKIILKNGSSSVMFDIGANLGQTSVTFAEAFHDVKIYSFEPDPEAFLKLQDHAAKYSNIEAHNIGFGVREEKMRLNINKGSGGNSILQVSDQIDRYAAGDWTKKISQRDVQITTLNSFCQLHQIAKIDLLKIDTQGYEMRVLEGAEQVVTPNVTKAVYLEVLFVELYKEQTYFSDIFRLLSDRGYKFVGFYNKFYKTERPHFLLWCDALFVSEEMNNQGR